MKLTVEQLRDVHRYLGKPMLPDMAKFINEESIAFPKGLNETMADIMQVCLNYRDVEPESGLAWHPVPTIDTTRISRLRVLADELNEAIVSVFKTSSHDKDELLDLMRSVRIDIGRVIAIAALSSPFGSSGSSGVKK